jgi:hypothetical protein
MAEAMLLIINGFYLYALVLVGKAATISLNYLLLRTKDFFVLSNVQPHHRIVKVGPGHRS